SPQLSNHEATEGRALEIAGIGAERSLSGPAAGYCHHGEDGAVAHQGTDPLTAIGRVGPRP
ncbi:MAG TPA: hypothetical protein VEG60_11080, partial [Candidatus Binatia bacterium]|nr:hypothetical protein [Candidatus Binatia bacterium]